MKVITNTDIGQLIEKNIYVYRNEIPIFPIILAIAFYSCVIVYAHARKYSNQYFQKILIYYLLMMPMALLGGRLVFVLTAQFSCGIGHYNLAYGGTVFYGGFIGATISLLLYCFIKKLDFLCYSDVYLSLLPLGQAIGRIGCYFNGCCYGCDYTGALAVPYVVDGITRTVFPTWFIESCYCGVLFVYFQFFYCAKRRGDYTATYLLMYSSFRFFLNISGVMKLEESGTACQALNG